MVTFQNALLLSDKFAEPLAVLRLHGDHDERLNAVTQLFHVQRGVISFDIAFPFQFLHAGRYGRRRQKHLR